MRRQVFGGLGSTQLPTKYIPTPQAANIILNYFVYNNFQDFNTWQQIAKTKVDYDYFQTQKAGYVCKIMLRWEDKTAPTLVQSAEAKSKRYAKKRALKKMIESIINQGYIGHGFKEDNFIEKLPRRRKSDSDDSEEELQEEKYPQKSTLQQLLTTRQYSQVYKLLASKDMKWKTYQLVQAWNYGLSIKSIDFLRNILRAYRGEEENQWPVQTWQRVLTFEKIAPRQFSYGKLVNNPLQEELTDFIRYQQLQKGPISKEQLRLRSPNIRARLLPSENILKEVGGFAPSRQQMILHFHPIEGRKLLFPSSIGIIHADLPRFETQQRDLTLKMTQLLYGLLLYYSLDYEFTEAVAEMMKQEILSVDLCFDHSVDLPDQQKGICYYLHHKNMLTVQFCYLLANKFTTKRGISIEGMISNLKLESHIFQFTCREPEEIIAKKINKRGNYNEFDEMPDISVGQMVAMINKIDNNKIYVGQIIEISPNIRIYCPQIIQGSDLEPYTLIKIYNTKVFEKTSTAISKVARTCLGLFRDYTTIIWQPPSYPLLSVIAELLVEWQTLKVNVLIVSLQAQGLHSELLKLGFKAVKITPKTQQKLLAKSSIVVATPSAVCCDLLKNYAFARVLIDNAHQISEVSSLSAFVKGCQRLYLIGDPFMPRMHVASPYCQLKGMRISLLERLYNEGCRTETFYSRLELNYEHRNVMDWADCEIYGGKLLLLGSENQAPVVKGFPWPSLDYRVCFVDHPQQIQQRDYLEEQAYIVSVICAEVAKSGYTKLEQITCSVSTQKALLFLQKRMGVLLRLLGCTQTKLFNRLMGLLCRFVSGSVYFRSELSIIMLGSDLNLISLREIVGALREGRRGVIILGDRKILEQNQECCSFLRWCRQKKVICKVDRKNLPRFFD